MKGRIFFTPWDCDNQKEDHHMGDEPRSSTQKAEGREGNGGNLSLLRCVSAVKCWVVSTACCRAFMAYLLFKSATVVGLLTFGFRRHNHT